jgi:virginiamycin B lyase
MLKAPDLGTLEKQLAAVKSRATEAPDNKETYLAVRAIGRAAVLANPLLDFDTLIFNRWSSSYGHVQEAWASSVLPDGGLFILSGLKTGQVTVKEAPRGPYGICATPAGDIWWCSLAGSFIAQIDRKTGDSRIVEPPTRSQGARRVWSDSAGRIWVSEWNSGNLSMHDPRAPIAVSAWRTWKLPGDHPRAYAVYVDEKDMVWVSDWGSNSIVRFDPRGEKFESWRHPRESANVRQILGRAGEVWLPESGTEHIVAMRTA